jgi:hypothetical protein
MSVRIAAIAVNDRGGDDVGVVWVNASDCDGLAEEVDVSISGASVRAGLDFDNIAVIRIVNCRLNVIEIRRPIVIDIDDVSHSNRAAERKQKYCHYQPGL